MGPPDGPGPEVARRNNLGQTALVCGLLSVPAALFLLPGAVLAVAAVAAGLLGHRRVLHGEATNDGSSVAGMVLGALTLAFVVTVVGLGAGDCCALR